MNNAGINNYNFVFSNSSSNAGGVALYVLNDFKFNRRHDLEFNFHNSENLSIEITLNSGKVLVVRIIYRLPPNRFDEFLDQQL